MRYTAVALAAAMAASPAFAAVGVSDFPGCATTCAVVSTSSPKDTGCTITNLKCVCSSSLYVQQVHNCLENPPSGSTKCSAADMEKTLQVSNALCSQAGYPLQQAASGSSSSASSASSAASSSKSSSSSASSSSASASGSTAAAASSSASSMTSSSSSGTASSTGTDTSSAAAESSTTESSTGGAEANAKVGMSFLAAAGLAAAAVL